MTNLATTVLIYAIVGIVITVAATLGFVLILGIELWVAFATVLFCVILGAAGFALIANDPLN